MPAPSYSSRLAFAALALAALLSPTGCPSDPVPERAPEPAPAPAPDLAPAPTGPKVAFLGDSVSAGLHLPADEAFPELLARRLQAQGVPFTPINAGVSGDTTAGGLRRTPFILKQRPAVVVIELGANDGLRGVPLAEIEANLRAIATQVRAAGAVPLLLGMRLPPSYGADYANGFDALYPRLAAELGVRLVPFFMEGVAGVAEMNLEDGLHPTARGHERLADNVQPALREVLQGLSPK